MKRKNLILVLAIFLISINLFQIVSSISPPPQIGLFFPQRDAIYDSKNVLVEFSLDEIANVYLSDLSKSRIYWKKICSNCNPAEIAFSKELKFNEGENQLGVKAVGEDKKESMRKTNFFIDSIPPKIYKTYPQKDWASGEFKVELTEENLKKVILNYGNENLGFNEIELNIKEDCIFEKRTICKTNLDLDEYDGETISYFFKLVDIANKTTFSKTISFDVDTLSPFLLNEDFFEVDSKYVYFNLEIGEENFDEVTYSYVDEKGKLREKRICTRLKNGFCEKKILFKEGVHELILKIKDKSENVFEEEISFFIDSKDPKINRVTSNRGLTNGIFSVEFIEEDPSSLTFYYLNKTKSRIVNIERECFLNKNKYSCIVPVDLGEYNGEEIDYFFELKDTIGNIEESKRFYAIVDDKSPQILNQDIYSIDSRKVSLNLEIDEENFKEVTYFYLNSRGKEIEKKICSRLNGNLCQKTSIFSIGEHNLNLKIKDKAGNTFEKPIIFEIVN